MFVCKIEHLETAVDALDRSGVGPLAECGESLLEITAPLEAALHADDPKETLRLAREAVKHSGYTPQAGLLDRIQCGRGRVTFRSVASRSEAGRRTPGVVLTFERLGLDEGAGFRMVLDASPLEEARVAACLFGMVGEADLFSALREAIRRCEEARGWGGVEDDETMLELEIGGAELEAMEKELKAEHEAAKQGAQAAAVAQVEAWKGAGLTADRAARMHPPMRAYFPLGQWDEFDAALKAELEAWKMGVPSLDEALQPAGA